MKNIFKLIIGFLFISIFAQNALAHFKLNLNVRLIHVEHHADGLNIYMRLPMPYLVADLLGEINENGLPTPAPYTTNTIQNDILVHYVDLHALESSLDEMKEIVKKSLKITTDDQDATLNVIQIYFYKNGLHSDFSTLDEAKTSFSIPNDLTVFKNNIYVGDTIVDVVLKYTSDQDINTYTLSSTLDPKLPDQEETANIILDYTPSGIQVFRERGLLLDPITITTSLYDAITTFIEEGIKHILDGYDHIIFVVCLVLGSLSFSRLLWRITGFTLGHSMTLALGFFGFVPSGAWFIPTVETGIALSIIYIAVMALLPDVISSYKKEKSEIKVVMVTALIGMLHGLGFSFLLQNILNVSSPNIWQSLLAFNIGVEIGQLFIVLCTLAFLYVVSKIGSKTKKLTRYGLGIGSIIIAVIWTVERAADIF